MGRDVKAHLTRSRFGITLNPTHPDDTFGYDNHDDYFVIHDRIEYNGIMAAHASYSILTGATPSHARGCFFLTTIPQKCWTDSSISLPFIGRLQAALPQKVLRDSFVLCLLFGDPGTVCPLSSALATGAGPERDKHILISWCRSAIYDLTLLYELGERLNQTNRATHLEFPNPTDHAYRNITAGLIYEHWNGGYSEYTHVGGLGLDG